MKVNVEIECTPEEARRAVGLPDLSPVHERYVTLLLETMDGRPRPELVEQLVRSWAPMGEAGLTLWRQLFEQGMAKE